MRGILISLLCLLIARHVSSQNLRNDAMHFDEQQIITACLMGKNHPLIRDYLIATDKKLCKINDTLWNANIMEFVVSPSPTLPQKSDSDILEYLKIFVELRPDETELICKEAIKGLIKNNDYLDVSHSFNYLLHAIDGKIDLYGILSEDEICRDIWEKDWRNYFRKETIPFLKETQIIEFCLAGKNHDWVRDYLMITNKKLNEIKDSISNKNIIAIVVSPYLIDCSRSDCIKSDIDMLKFLEIFVELRPDETELIYEEAVKGLVRYNDYLYVPYAYNYLRNMLGSEEKVYEILKTDEVCKKIWEKGWVKNCD